MKSNKKKEEKVEKKVSAKSVPEKKIVTAKKELSHKTKPHIEEAEHIKVQTAEGWKRNMLKKRSAKKEG